MHPGEGAPARALMDGDPCNNCSLVKLKSDFVQSLVIIHLHRPFGGIIVQHILGLISCGYATGGFGCNDREGSDLRRYAPAASAPVSLCPRYHSRAPLVGAWHLTPGIHSQWFLPRTWLLTCDFCGWLSAKESQASESWWISRSSDSQFVELNAYRLADERLWKQGNMHLAALLDLDLVAGHIVVHGPHRHAGEDFGTLRLPG
jgi:hypothetical protein